MEEYRKIAQQKYQLQKQKEAEEEAEKQEHLRLTEEKEEAEREEKEEAERMEKENLERMQFVLDMWDGLSQLFPIHMSSVQELTVQVENTLELFQHYDRMDEMRERTVQLVETVNTQHELFPHSNDDIRHVHQVMKTLLDTCGVDVPIEVMDVSQDETMAQRIQDELFQEQPIHTIPDASGAYMNPYVHQVPLPSALPATDQPMSVLATMLQQLQQQQQQQPMVNDRVPICSVSRRIGLTVPQLKEVARAHMLSQQGTKEELCRRLQQAGLVRIV
jgi:hypothetical protein